MTTFNTLTNSLTEAGEVLLKHFGKIEKFDRKSDIDLVTAADREAEELIKRIIGAAHPGHEILAEESGLSKGGIGSGGIRWLVDPVDGTTNFAHGFPIFAVSIAVEKDGEIIQAGVYNPVMKEMFLAEKGGGARLNDRSIQVSKIDSLRDSLIISGFPYDRRERVLHYLKAWELMLCKAQGMLRLGSAALDLCYVAAGRAEAFWEESLQPWDTAAGLLILEEAGGKVTNFSDQRFNPYMNQVLGTNGLVHEAVLEVLRERQRCTDAAAGSGNKGQE